MVTVNALAVPVARLVSSRRAPPPSETIAAPTPLLSLAALILSRRSASVLAGLARFTVNDLPPTAMVTSPLPTVAPLLA